MNSPARLWARLRASFWFTPTLIVVGSLVAAALLVEADAWQEADLSDWSPRLFGAGAEGSRAMLSAIATSMVTVAGVVFSITIVALSLTSTQYSPRVLRNFMRDAPTQAVLGVFLGIFAYCLVVLRTIRGGDEGVFIPSLAVMGGIVYALVGTGVLIYFIHHVALSIQAASILQRIAADTERAIDLMFPQQVGSAAGGEEAADVQLPSQWTAVAADRSGYLQAVDTTRLLRLASEGDRVVRLLPSIGAYVSEGEGVLEVSGPVPGEQDRALLRGCLALGRQRTLEQDAAFGFEQLVDVALRALSPSLNDPSTARMCLNALGTLLARLAGRTIPSPFRFEHGTLRVIAPTLDFGETVAATLRPILRYGGGDPGVIASAIDAVRTAGAGAGADRRRALLAVTHEFRREVARVRPRSDANVLRQRLRALQEQLRGDDAP